MMANPNMGGLGGGFPAPGMPSSAQGQNAAGSTAAPQAGTGTASQPQNLFNPFGAVPPAGGGAGATPPPGGMFGDPALMQQMLSAFGGGSLGGGALGGGGGLGDFPAAPTDTRPPEERFQVQLQVHIYFT